MADNRATAPTRSLPGQDAWRSDAKLPPLQINFYRQMKPQRVYPVEVSWQKPAQPLGERREVTVRLTAPGAQVVPAEHLLNAAQPGVKAVFYVTPLAKGWLPQQKLEVFAQGQKVQTIGLPAKVVTQRRTWVLLLLTFFVPWLIVEHVKNSELGEPVHLGDRVKYPKIETQVEETIKDNVPIMPEFLKETPVERGLFDLRRSVAKAYQQVVLVSRIEPLGFYAGAVLFTLTVISAFLRKPKRRYKKAKPLSLEALTNPVGAEKS